MTDHKPIKTVSIIGLGAIGSFLPSSLRRFWETGCVSLQEEKERTGWNGRESRLMV